MSARVFVTSFVMALMCACSAQPAAEIGGRPLNAAEIRVYTQHGSAQILAHRNVDSETIVLISEGGQLGYERLTVRELGDVRGTITALARMTVLPDTTSADCCSWMTQCQTTG